MIRGKTLVFFGAALAAELLQGRTVALWPIEFDPQTGEKNLRCAVDPRNDLSCSVGKADAGITAWNLPPNPDAFPHIFYPVSRSAWNLNGEGEIGVKSSATAVRDALMPLNDFTIEGYVRFDALPTAAGWQVLVRSIPGSVDSNYYWMWTLRKPDDAKEQYRFQVYTGGQNNGDLYGTLFTPSADFVGTWHHIALVFTFGASETESRYQVYLDGAEVLNQTRFKKTAPGGTWPGPNILIGGRGSQRTPGAFTYWRVSDQALAASAFLNAGGGEGTLVPQAVRTSTVAYWKMTTNEDGSLDVKDYVGTANLTKGFTQNSINSAALPCDDCAFTGQQPPNTTVTLAVANAGCASLQTPGSGLRHEGIGGRLLPTGSFTIEGWYRPHQEAGTGLYDTNDFGRILCVCDLADTNYAWSLKVTKDLAGARSFSLVAGDDTTFEGGAALADGVFPSAALAATDDAWHHLALVYDATQAESKGAWTLYLDGAVCGTVANVRTPAYAGTTYALYIGGSERFGLSVNRAKDAVFGHYDTWRVAAAALQANQLMCAADGVAATDVLALWPLDSCRGLALTGVSDISATYKFNSVAANSTFDGNAVLDAAPAISNPDVSPRFDGRETAATKSVSFTNGNGRFICMDRRVLDLIGDGRQDWTLEMYMRRAAAIDSDWEILLAGCQNLGNFTSLQLNYSYRTDGFKLLNTAVGWGGDQPFSGTTDALPNDGEFHHVALVQDCRGGTIPEYRLYVDGELKSTQRPGAANFKSLGGLIFGGRTNGSIFHGAYGGMRLSEGALPTNQFLCAAQESFGAEPTDFRTMAYWSLDAGDGSDEIASQVAPGYRLSVESGTATGEEAQAVSFIRCPDATEGFIGDAKVNAGSVRVAGVGLAETQKLGAYLDFGRPFTVEGWMKAEVADGAKTALFGTAETVGDSGWRVFVDATGAKPALKLFAKTPQLGTPLVSATLVEDISAWADEWKHVALVYDPVANDTGTWTLLVDGVAVAMRTNAFAATGLGSGKTVFRIGASPTDTMEGFTGGVDEWRVTCGVRTAENILYRARKGVVVIFR